MKVEPVLTSDCCQHLIYTLRGLQARRTYQTYYSSCHHYNLRICLLSIKNKCSEYLYRWWEWGVERIHLGQYIWEEGVYLYPGLFSSTVYRSQVPIEQLRQLGKVFCATRVSKHLMFASPDSNSGALMTSLDTSCPIKLLIMKINWSSPLNLGFYTNGIL